MMKNYEEEQQSKSGTLESCEHQRKVCILISHHISRHILAGFIREMMTDKICREANSTLIQKSL